MLRLVIEDDEGTTHVVPLIRDEITIGRQEGNTIRLTERNVSRRHARLVRTGDNDSPTVLVEDLDSFNGLKLNGDRVSSKCTMRPGDLIQIGDYSLALRVDQASEKESRDTEISMGPPAGLDDVATQLHRFEDEVLPADEQGRLVVVSSNLAGTTYALDRREVIIGRTDENDVVVNHRSISRNHAKVIYRDGTFTIIDLASSNGVKVNGEDFGTASMVNGDIIELGHVKLRYVAPGDDYVFSLADIDDVQIDRGPGTGRLVLIGLLLVAVAGGAFMLVNRTVEPGSGAGATVDPPTPPKPTPPPPPVDPVDVDALMAEGQALLRDEKWAEATNVFDRVLQDQPEHAEAKRLKKQATRESEHKRRYDQLLQDTDDQQWHDAYFALVDFPDDSIYHARLDTVRDKIQNGFADFEVNRARDLAKRGDLEGARKLQASLGEKPFAKAQADKLAAELDEMGRARERAREREAARESPPVAAKPPQTPPVKRPPRDRPAPRAAAGPDDDEDEYSKLMKEALRLVARGERSKAVELLEKAQRMRPSDQRPHQRLCAIYRPMGRLEKALHHCKMWLALEKNGSYKPAIRRNIQQLEAELNR